MTAGRLVSMERTLVTIVDPPSGWRYGFPASLEEDYEAQLRRAKYPEEDIQFAIEHSRYWEQPDG